MTMKVWTNLTGTMADEFTIGVGGATLYHGAAAPSASVGQNGDLYIRHDSQPGLYQMVSGAWTLVSSSFVRQVVPQGSSATVQDVATYVAVTSGTAKATQLTLPAGILNQQITVKDEAGTAASRPVTILAGATIDGASSYVISSNYGSVTVAFTGQYWFVVRKA